MELQRLVKLFYVKMTTKFQAKCCNPTLRPQKDPTYIPNRVVFQLVFYTPNRKFLGIYENPYLEYFEEHSIRNDDFNTKDEKTKFKFKVGHDDR